MNIVQNVRLAFRSIRGNLLRTVLTILIIAFGIMALVGILTAMQSIAGSISSSFSDLGANSFKITENRLIGGSRGGHRQDRFPDITYRQAMRFKDKYTYPADVSVSADVFRFGQIKFRGEATQPQMAITGIDDNYMTTSGLTLAAGRHFSPLELEKGRNVVIVGSDVAEYFRSAGDLLDQNIDIGSARYKVIGILNTRGASIVANDKFVLVPLENGRARYGKFFSRYDITVQVAKPEDVESAVSEAIGLFRNVRGLSVREKNNFTIRKSDSISQILFENLSFVAFGAAMIGFITLFGAAIALMNILLVSVNERTREIGVLKALGAKNTTIRWQFLTEALVICQLGGILGILAGILIGNIVSYFTGSAFVVPWLWMILGVSLCLITGLVAGAYPAYRAANLDPIEALRFE